MKIHTTILAIIVAALLLVAHGCSVLKRGAFTGGGAASGAAIGSLAGPGGAIGGAAVGAIAGQAIGENAELRDGDLVGEGAAGKYIIREVPKPFIPSWIWWAAIGALVWFKGHHLLNFFRGGGLDSLLRFFAVKRTIKPKSQPTLKTRTE